MPTDTENPTTRTIVEELEALLEGIPDSPNDLKANRERLVASLEGFHPADNPLAQAVQDCVSALRERHEELVRDIAGPARDTDALPELEFHQKATMAIPASAIQVDAEEEAEPVEGPEEEPSGKVRWGKAERLLYEDVLCLFDLGDQPGAMTSMERLIMLCPDAEELEAFLDKNGEALVKLYHEYFGSLERIPIPIRDAEPVKIPTEHAPLVMDILQLIDGHRNIREILKRSKLEEIQALGSVAHLARSGFIELA